MNLENSNLLVRWQILHYFFLFNNQADAMNLKSSIVRDTHNFQFEILTQIATKSRKRLVQQLRTNQHKLTTGCNSDWLLICTRQRDLIDRIRKVEVQK